MKQLAAILLILTASALAQSPIEIQVRPEKAIALIQADFVGLSL